MADAVYAILTQDSRACTGNFFVDETLLRQQGVTDFEQYSVVPGTTDFMFDYFLDENLSQFQQAQSPLAKNYSKKSESNVSKDNEASGDIGPVFDRIKSLFTPELLKKIDSVYAFDLQG
jgi:hypothetical protein